MRATARSIPRPQRFAEAAVFVSVWIGLGFALRPDANLYLVIGVPLTVAFQLLARRARLEDLWVRGGRPFTRPWFVRVGVVTAVTLLVLLTLMPLPITLWVAAAMIGAFGAAYSLRHVTRETVRAGIMCLATGGAIGVVIIVIVAATGGLVHRPVGARAAVAAIYLPLYFVVSFVLEEVFFRGAIDSHVHGPGESMGLLSAAAVSAAWGLWHLPLSRGPVITTIWQLLAVHVPVGTALSLFWRRSGNLAVPAFTHAFINAVRNALIV